MTKRDVLTFVFRYKNTVIGWWLFIVALVVLLSYLLPQSYRATGSVLVERNSPPVAVDSNYRAPERAEAMNTEIQILLSRPVVEAVVDQLRLDQPNEREERPLSLRDRLGSLLVSLGLKAEKGPRETWIETLTQFVEAKAVVDSSVLTIGFSSSDPTLAMNVVNAVTDAYIAHRREVYSSRGLSSYFKSNMDEALAQLEELRSELADFKQNNDMTAISDRQGELVKETARLRERMTLLRAERAELRTRFAASHPRVTVADQNIAAAQRQLDDRLKELHDLEEGEATVHELETLIQSQERVFLDYKQQYEQEKAREAAPENFVNSRVISYAPLPGQPRFSRLSIIKLGILGGFVFALLIAFLREYFNNRVSTPDQAERALGVPVLASVPKTRALRS
jgi:uncharacterized protein involved in exopolysaccharide biosynthesis